MDIQKFQTIEPPIPKKLKEEESKKSEGSIILTSINVSKANKEKKQKKKVRKKCQYAGCRVKLKLTDVECRCNNRYCSKHRLPETHDCLHDYKKINMEEFCRQAGLGGGEVKKVTKI